MTDLTDLLGIILVLEVVAVIVAVAYIVRVYRESRRNAQGRVPRLYNMIAIQAGMKVLIGGAIAAVLVAFWSGVDTRGWGGIVIGVSVMVMLSTPLWVAYSIWRVRTEENDA